MNHLKSKIKIALPWDVEGTRLPRYKPEDNLHNHRIKNL